MEDLDKNVAILVQHIYIGFDRDEGVPQECKHMAIDVSTFVMKKIVSTENFCGEGSTIVGPSQIILTKEEATEEMIDQYDLVMAKTLLCFHKMSVRSDLYSDVIAIITTIDNTNPCMDECMIAKEIRHTDEIMKCKDKNPEKWDALPIIESFWQKTAGAFDWSLADAEA